MHIFIKLIFPNILLKKYIIFLINAKQFLKLYTKKVGVFFIITISSRNVQI